MSGNNHQEPSMTPRAAPPPSPSAFSAGLQQLREQLAVAFTGQRSAAVPTPVAFSAIAAAGRDAKDALAARYAARP